MSIDLSPAPLADSDYPSLHQAADRASVSKQRSYLRSVQLGLVFAVLAAACGAAPGGPGRSSMDVFFAVITALAFVGALAVELSVLGSRTDKTWYEGRALAESAKTLTWRYVACADPFPADASAQAADELFLDRIRDLQHDLSDVPLLPSTTGNISERMRRLRAAPLAERKHAYLVGRLRDQQSWYAAKAVFHQRRASLYRTLTLLLEVVGIAAALSKAIGFLDFDLAGVVAACVSAFAAWSATRQHQTTGAAYVVTSHELGVISDLLRRDMTEPEWAALVSDAETAISREHTMWRASHVGR